MLMPIFKRYKKQNGFTIVELLIVIVVIAILVAITIVAFNGVSKKAKATAAQSASSQAAKKIVTYAAENSDNYPATLAAANVVDANGTTYQYSVNNNVSPRTYCITATVQNVSYYIDNGSNLKPTEGACPGHGSNGLPPNIAVNSSFETPGSTVVTRTNLLLDPRAEGGTGWNFYAGPSQVTAFTNPSVSWSQSGKARRGTWTTYVGNGGGFEVTSNSFKPALTAAGANNPVTYRYRIVASTNGMTIGAPTATSTSGSLTTIARSRGTAITAVAGTVYEDWITFSSPDPSALNTDARNYTSIGPMAQNNYFEASDGDMYFGSYDANRSWFSGASAAAGDFTYGWTGAANASTSIQTAVNNPNFVVNGTGNVNLQSSARATSGSESAQVLVNHSTNQNPGLYQNVALGAGTYTFIAKVWLEPGLNSSVTTTVQGTNVTLNTVSGYPVATTTEGQWVEVRRAVTVPAASNANFFIYIGGTATPVGKSFWVDEFAVVEGTCTTAQCY